MSFNLILSPLDQFEIKNLINLELNILGDIQISLTNIGLYLTLSATIVLILHILATNLNKIVANEWSINQESLYSTIHSIVINQINSNQGQMYFPFIYGLFIYILIIY